jgi:hypothetical protein
MTDNTREQIRNVLDGRTAMGAPGEGRIRFPRAPRAFLLLLSWTYTFLQHSPASDDATRTAFIRKLAHYLIRCGTQDENNTAFLDGVVWFLTNPEHIQSRMSFARAVRLRAQQLKRTIPAGIDTAPPYPVLFTGDGYTFVELIHPVHLIRIGLEAGNCLARHRGKTAYANPNYWRAMNGGPLHLYALSDTERLRCVFSAIPGKFGECEFIGPRPELDPIFRKCLEAVERQLGPFADNPASLLSAENQSRAARPAMNGFTTSTPTP